MKAEELIDKFVNDNKDDSRKEWGWFEDDVIKFAEQYAQHVLGERMPSEEEIKLIIMKYQFYMLWGELPNELETPTQIVEKLDEFIEVLKQQLKQ